MMAATGWMAAGALAAEPLKYPEAKRGEVVEKIHGVEVADPYRWLEEIDSPETKAFVKAQSELAEGFLSKLPRRAAIKDRLKELWDYDKHGLPEKVAGKLIYSRKTGLQNQGVLYWREDREGAEERLLLDPNKLSEDGTVALAGSAVSDDGKLLAYGLSRAGSDWQDWGVMEIDSGKKLEDELKWVKFSHASWEPDGKAFYYGRYDEPKPGQELKEANYNQKLYRHVVGTPQTQDTLVYARPDHPKWGLHASVTDDGQYFLLSVSEGTAPRNGFFFKDLKAGPDAPMVELMKDFDAKYDFVGHDGATFYFHTDHSAPKGRLVAVDTKDPAPAKWRTVIPEGKGTLQGVSYLDGKLLAQFLVDAHDEARVFDTTGKELGTVPVPNLGSLIGLGGRQKDAETFYSVTGYTLPGGIFRYDVKTGKSTPFWEPKVKFDPAKYVTEQVFYASKDGTKVPMFITRRKDLEKNGQTPTILYGYGGFNISMSPAFSPSVISWLEQGGLYAVANLRGGGEYGEDWHQAGQLLKKQNVFDDFIAAGEYLVAEKYTSKAKLAISGGSNGGLLVAACLNQRPDLFAAGAPSVGVHDLLRFHKFTIGWAWQDEYGHPDEKEADFKNLLKLSPYHNVKKGGNYPWVMVETADHDDRVFPAHSFKYGAALQWAQGGAAPVLLRIETKAGHGAGTPTSKVIEKTADVQAFFLAAMNHD